MIHPLTQIGHPVIRRVAEVVTLADIKTARMKRLLRDLVDSMREHELVGIAAPQLGRGVRVFVTELRPTSLRKMLKEIDEVRIYINPEIVRASQQQAVLYEGCGSLIHGQLFGPVRRPQSVTVRALNEHGQSFTLTAQGLLAKVIQHEFDHLQGIICLDKFVDTREVMERGEYLKTLAAAKKHKPRTPRLPRG